MGKPFSKELLNIPSIINWGFDLQLEEFIEFLIHKENLPLFVVGSGGSLSACNFVSLLQKEFGHIAIPITPLSIMNSTKLLKKSKVLFISSSGQNLDIINSFKTVINYEPERIFSLIMRKGSKLANLSDRYTISKYIEFDIPTGKDGFLATNTLIGYFIILSRAYEKISNTFQIIPEYKLDDHDIESLREFVFNLPTDPTLTLLHSEWGQPIAVDLESKFVEAALCNVNMSDYRNFGHGRHHWLAKRYNNSAVISLHSNDEKRIAEMTLSKFPQNIKSLKIESQYSGPMASIDLLIKSFHLVNLIGEKQRIDPGRPGVPEFGRKLYNLNYYSIINKKNIDKISRNTVLAIQRKTKVNSIEQLSRDTLGKWVYYHSVFTRKLNKGKYGAVVFDYDGTLCSSKDRFIGLSNIIATKIIKLLDNNILVGIVTGRGDSVKIDLRKMIPENYWGKIFIGYYNGSDFAKLCDDSSPDLSKAPVKELKLLKDKIEGLLENDKYCEIKLHPKQLSIKSENSLYLDRVKIKINYLILKSGITNVKMFESSHSIDIIDSKISKLNFYNKIKELLQKEKDILCIGDKGDWPGNDCELLTTPFSLSVDEVSDDPETCWNLSSAGIKNVDSTVEYLTLLKLI